MKDSDRGIPVKVRVQPEVVAALSGDHNQSSPVGTLQSDARHRQPLIGPNDTAAAYPDACIHELFEIQVDRTPTAPAIVFDGHRLTYQDLNRRANQLARHLRALGVTRETLVGVSVERSQEMIVALLGILKAGGAYIPLDPRYPTARLTFMLEDSRAPVVLTHERLASRLSNSAQVVCLDRDRAVLEGSSPENLSPGTTPDDPAYVIYTSGTTGQPKGVVGLHRGAVNRFAWMWRAYPFAEDDVCCQKTSLNFVDSVAEIFVPLLQGIPAVIIPDDVVQDPSRLVDSVGTAAVTRLVLVPSLLRDILALDNLRDRLPGLKMCVSSGEVLPADLCRRVHERLPHAILLNLYGSTEVSADVSCYDTTLLTPAANTVPLGWPIDNTQIYILDETLQPVPAGISGELYVGGDGLARGYLNRPDLTAERFVRNPFSDAPSARIYKTGDRARYLPDGSIEFLGRLDQQVKIRGVRVELGEVEAAVVAHADIAQAAVIAREDDPNDARLVAYVVPKDISMRAFAHVRSFCKERLPDYMVPSAFVPLERLPLTPSGKIDRRALPAPEPARSDVVDGAFVAPRTSVEAQLVAIWEETLGVKGIGITDDFFDLGGHSLLAVQMWPQIDKLYGPRPVSVLARASTIERLADVLSHPEDAEPPSLLVDLQPRGDRRPLFLVHGIGGEVLSLAGLAHRLAPDQPVYGIRAKGSDGTQEPLSDVESMAACYLEAVRTVAPQGPYLLGGYCSGGTVALEMARQLRARGDEVALLAMIDTEAPETGHGARWWNPRLFAAYLRNMGTWVVDDDFFRLAIADKMARLRSKGRLLRARVRSLGSSMVDADIRDVLGVWRFPDQHRAFLETHARALANYEMREYDGPITLIRARTVSLSSLSSRDLGWSRLAKGTLDIRVVPGAHDNILTEPRVRVLAAHLKTCLNSAHAKIATLACLVGPVVLPTL
jgi:amino acid adenylation domain-containing protein